MEWKAYFEERLNAIPDLVKMNISKAHAERAIMFRIMRFANSFVEGRGDSRIIILYGLRGIGKSTILFQTYNRLVSGRFFKDAEPTKEVPRNNILYVSLDQALLQIQYSDSVSPLYESVRRFVEEMHGKTLETLNERIFILVDEAQFDKKWASAAKAIFDSSKNVFLVITGSSALALNIDTDTARRAIKEPLFPLSFMEYQMLKNRVFPAAGTAEALKKLVLTNDASHVNSLNRSLSSMLEVCKKKRLNIEGEFIDYLTFGGFPHSLSSTKEVTYRKLLDMITRIVTQDLPAVSNFETNTQPEILRIIGSLAIPGPGEISHNKLSQNLGIPISKVKGIIDALEKTHLIFSVKPFPNIQAQGLSKVFKYYFLSPTLLTSIRHLNGKTNFTNHDQGALWESAVASNLLKLGHTTGTIYQLFYDPRKETNVDFLLQNPLSGEVIPFEVGLNKGDTQISNAIEHYKSTHGVLISDFSKISVENKIIKVPIWFFLYL